MSRRRDPRPEVPGAMVLSLECSMGKRGPHRQYRIAKVRSWPDPEPERDMGAIVRVQYVHAPDEDRADSWRIRQGWGADVHITWPFWCGECGRYLPILETNLGRLVASLASLGVSRIELSKIHDAIR